MAVSGHSGCRGGVDPPTGLDLFASGIIHAMNLSSDSSSPARLSPSRRRRLLIAAIVALVFAVVFFGYSRWRQAHPTAENYRALVSTFTEGVVALEVSDDEHALPSLLLATQIAPQEPAAWADLGIFYLRHNNPDAARQAIEKASALAPHNSQILTLRGVLDTQESKFAEAAADYQQAVALDPSNLQARYALGLTRQQLGGPDDDAQAQKQLQAIADAAPDNLFAAIQLAESAAKAGQGDIARQMTARLTAHSTGWSPEILEVLKATQKAVAGGDPRAAILPLKNLENVISQDHSYHSDLLKIQGDEKIIGIPLTRFLSLPNPSVTPAAPDLQLKFTPQPLRVPGSASRWAWAETVLLAPQSTAPPTLAVADGRTLRVGAVSLPFPGGPQAVPPTPNGVVAFDADNDGRMDFACAGAGGLKLYHQEANGVFTDVTAQAKLPPAFTGGAYTGVWTCDIDTDGDLDLMLGTASGTPTVLRNNGDGTWSVLHPFPSVTTGLSQFAWADLDGDGSSDAALIDAQGKLVVLQNKRAGVFLNWPLPAGLGKLVAVSAADTDTDGTQDLVALSPDGEIQRLGRRDDGGGWTIAQIGAMKPETLIGPQHLHWADLDNNGALDLVISGEHGGAQIFLGTAQSTLTALLTPLAFNQVTVDAAADRGRLDLIGLTSTGQPVRLVNSGSKNYAGQDIRLKALKPGDKRNNTYGIGSEISLRAGLLYENQLVSGPITHFGLGDYAKADGIRILWTNGTPQAEFNLKPEQVVEVPERLIGSCPWLFADNGTGTSAEKGMKFVTDFIWRSPLGLRINAQDTAGVVQTRDWVKVRGDQLQARDGFYNLRITADLWETHFFDQIALKTVDHPVGTDVFVDERFSIPPPPLAVNAMTPPVPVIRAVDDLGKDVTTVVHSRDGKYLDTGVGEYQGVTRDHWVTLGLGPDTPEKSLRWLVAEGWIHPTDSSINLALGQGHAAPPHDLSLEIPDGHGGWKVARPHLGFPEGKNKTILIDITGLPRQVRLRTNLEIYWDFIGTSRGLLQTPQRTQTLAPAEATLRYRGFSATTQANHSSPELPDYARLAGTGPRWLDLEGYYTRFGDVRSLLARTDDRYVIMNAGDEIVLRFPAPPSPPTGWTRDYVLIGDGWVKDGNYNTAFSRTVLPLPAHSRPAYNIPPRTLADDPVYQAHRRDWQTFQTRWVTPQRFREGMVPPLKKFPP